MNNIDMKIFKFCIIRKSFRKLQIVNKCTFAEEKILNTNKDVPIPVPSLFYCLPSSVCCLPSRLCFCPYLCLRLCHCLCICSCLWSCLSLCLCLCHCLFRCRCFWFCPYPPLLYPAIAIAPPLSLPLFLPRPLSLSQIQSVF